MLGSNVMSPVSDASQSTLIISPKQSHLHLSHDTFCSLAGIAEGFPGNSLRNSVIVNGCS